LTRGVRERADQDSGESPPLSGARSSDRFASDSEITVGSDLHMHMHAYPKRHECRAPDNGARLCPAGRDQPQRVDKACDCGSCRRAGRSTDWNSEIPRLKKAPWAASFTRRWPRGSAAWQASLCRSSTHCWPIGRRL